MRVPYAVICLAQLFTACVYPKVSLTKDEKNRILYQKKKTSVTFQNQGNRSAISFLRMGSRNGFERNFDFWWSRRVHDNQSRKRGFYHSVWLSAGSPNEEHGNSDLYISFQRINFVKKSDDDSLTLSIEGFSPAYVLNLNTPDTLVFFQKQSQCRFCVSEITWEKSKGIIQLKKSEVWTRVEN
jgi:hypothetical protein